MNSWAVVCAYSSHLFGVCIVLCYNFLLQFLSHVKLLLILLLLLLAVTVIVVVHPLMFKLLIFALPRFSAMCFPGCLSCLPPGPYDTSVLPMVVIFPLACVCLAQPWISKTITTDSLTPQNSSLAVAMTTSCCPVLLLPACPACGTLPCPFPVPMGDCPPACCLWLTVLWGNGVVHQNLGLLLTGTTSARSVSTRSRERRFPWVTTPPSHRRKYYSI